MEDSRQSEIERNTLQTSPNYIEQSIVSIEASRQKHRVRRRVNNTINVENSEEKLTNFQDLSKTIVSLAEINCKRGSSHESCFQKSCQYLNKYASEIECAKLEGSDACESLRKVTLDNPQIASKELIFQPKEFQFCSHLRVLDLSQNLLQDKGLMVLSENKNILESVEDLNLAENYIGKLGAKILSLNIGFRALKNLNLSKNSIGSEGIKHMSEGAIWTELKMLILNDIGLDLHGTKALSENESWKNLRELHLQDNPVVGNLGCMILTCNKGWKSLKVLIVNNSKIEGFGIKSLRKNRSLKRFFSDTDRAMASANNQHESQSVTKFNEVSLMIAHPKNENSRFDRILDSQRESRGGAGGDIGQGKIAEGDHLPNLITKINEYKKRLLNDKTFEEEFKLYIEPFGRLAASKEESDFDSFELATEIKKRQLSRNSDLKVLLLIGAVGSGKTLFCKYLQAITLSEPVDPQSGESEEITWLPILVDVSRFKESKPLLSEILRQELSLTESEIRLLQNGEPNKALPGFLFIFDGFNQTQQLNDKPLNLYTLDDCIKNNFCASVGFESCLANAKVIITCRSELVSEISRREMLFGLLDRSTNTLLPNSFSEFVFKPLSDTQISTYLKRYTFLNGITLWDAALGSKSWSLIKTSEGLIESYGLKELVRNPLLLSMVVTILPELSQPKKEQTPTRKGKQTHRMTTRTRKSENDRLRKLNLLRVYELYTDHVIEATIQRDLSSKNLQMNEEETKLLVEKFKEQVQNLALRLSSSSSSQSAESESKELKENDLLLAQCPLLEFNCKRPRFTHKSYEDFFVAKMIEEEIMKYGKDKGSLDPNQMIFNQRLLWSSSVSISIFQFLIDSVRDEILPASVLLKLVHKSSSKNPRNAEQKSHGTSISQQICSLHPFSMAAANAITILNTTGYDFKNLDFSKLCIAGANLNHGEYEGANFTEADLQGVDFSAAWLKDAKFERANLQGVQFGVTPDLVIDKEASCIAHSPDGNHLAIGSTKGELIVYKKYSGPKPHYREIKRLKGQFRSIRTCSFSKDSQYVILGGDNGSVHILDFEKGDCIQVLNKDSLNRVLSCELIQDGKQMISSGNEASVEKWSFLEGKWTFSLKIRSEMGITNSGFVPNRSHIIFVGNPRHGPSLYHYVTGKYIRKLSSKTFFRYRAQMSQYSPDGKQVALGTNHGKILLLDGVRDQLIKNLALGSQGLHMSVAETKFSSCGTHIISMKTTHLRVQDLTGARNLKNQDAYIIDYSIDPVEHDKIAILLKDNRVGFSDLGILNNFSKIVKGANMNGFSIEGTNIDDALGLSEKNIMVFDQKGDYQGFGKEKIQELILNNRKEDIKNVTEIHLSLGDFGEHGAKVIGRNTKWINLKNLDLSKSNIGDQNGVVLGKNVSWKNLQELILCSNSLGNKALAAISKNLTWKNLKRLDLASNNIHVAGAKSLGQNSIWESLEELNLSKNQINDSGAVAVSQNSTWKKLKKLDLSSNHVKDQGAGAIAKNKAFSSLEELNLSNNKIGDEGGVEIGGNKLWKQLKLLSLESNNISDSGATVISKNSSWVNLEELYIYSNDISGKCAHSLKDNKAWSKIKIVVWIIDNQNFAKLLQRESMIKNISSRSQGLSDTEAILIGRTKIWTELERLQLPKNMIGDAGASALAKNTSWKKLKDLSLQDNNIGDEGVVSICGNATWSNLGTLHLDGNEIGDKGAAAIGNNTSWGNLTNLDVAANKINGEGAVAIGMNTIWSDLRVLNLQRNEISDTGAKGIGKNISWVNLTGLNLSANKIGPEGAIAIGSNTVWVHLGTLRLAENEIGDKGAVGLANNAAWSRLFELNLSTNRIGDEGVMALASNTIWTGLRILSLESNQIGPKGGTRLGENVAWVKLTQLNLAHNKIGDEGAISIGSNTAWNQLETIDLKENGIGDKGAVMIGKNQAWRVLQELKLRKNRIGDEGGVSLGSNSIWTELRELDLGENNIGDTGAAAIAKNPVWVCLISLVLNGNKIGDEGAVSIGENTIWDLEVLRFEDNEIGDRGAAAIGANLSWSSLGSLFLNGNKIGDEGILAIANNTTWTGITELHIYNNTFKNEGAIQQAFATEDWEHNETFIYSINPEVQSFLEKIKNQSITQVCLPSKGLRDKDAMILAEKLPPTVEILNLASNNIEDLGMRYINWNSSWKNLKSLDLSANNIGRDSAARIGENLSWLYLQELNLSKNEIGDESAFSILGNPTFRNLTKLNLSATKIGDKTAMGIGKSVRWKNLEELDLSENEIGDEGALVLGQNRVWKKLVKFEIQANAKITEEGKKELKSSVIFGSFVRV